MSTTMIFHPIPTATFTGLVELAVPGIMAFR